MIKTGGAREHRRLRNPQLCEFANGTLHGTAITELWKANAVRENREVGRRQRRIDIGRFGQLTACGELNLLKVGSRTEHDWISSYLSQQFSGGGALGDIRRPEPRAISEGGRPSLPSWSYTDFLPPINRSGARILDCL